MGGARSHEKDCTVGMWARQNLCGTNFHDCANDKGIMFMWSESIVSRGSHEIGSAILKYLQLTGSKASHLMVFSDACGGHNRNINIACLWMYVVSSSDFPYSVVDHKFRESGHSYLPNDRDFGSIEKASRKNHHFCSRRMV